jgi:predicted outer membrane protein
MMSNIQELEAACMALENSTNKEIAALAGVVRELIAVIVRQAAAAAIFDTPAPADANPTGTRMPEVAPGFKV